jgi:hypothetical protein
MIPSRARMRLVLAGIWILFGAISGLQIQVSMLAHHHSWALLTLYQVIVWSAWIPFTLAIGALLGRVPLTPPRALRVACHALVALGFGVAHVALWDGVELLLKPYDFMNPTAFGPRFRGVALHQMPLEVVLYGLVVLAWLVRDTLARERARAIRAAQLETSLAEARLHALELQIRPHFLFNTLNGIGALVRAGQATEALAMIGGLSDLLRYALDRAGGQRVALEEELGVVERYLAIQRLRFGARLAYTIDASREAARARVPVLLLQPLVENAVTHGVAQSEAPGTVSVRAAREDGSLVVEVFNTGRLRAEAPRGIGLSATADRLAQMFGAAASFTLAPAEGRAGVVARVTIPWSAVA